MDLEARGQVLDAEESDGLRRQRYRLWNGFGGGDHLLSAVAENGLAVVDESGGADGGDYLDVANSRCSPDNVQREEVTMWGFLKDSRSGGGGGPAGL